MNKGRKGSGSSRGSKVFQMTEEYVGGSDKKLHVNRKKANNAQLELEPITQLNFNEISMLDIANEEPSINKLMPFDLSQEGMVKIRCHHHYPYGGATLSAFPPEMLNKL